MARGDFEIPVLKQYYFRPDHTVAEDELLPVTIISRDSYDQITRGNPEGHRQNLARQIKYSPRGVPYAVLSGEDYSTTSAVGSKTPFANRIVPRDNDRFSWNLIIKSDFARLDAERAGIADDEGRPKPWIIVGNPASDHRLQLSKDKKKKLANGDFSPLAEELIQITEEEGFEELEIVCYSKSVSTGAAVPRTVEESGSGLKVVGGALIEPINIRSRFLLHTMINYWGFDLQSIKESRAATIKPHGSWVDQGPRLRLEMEDQPSKLLDSYFSGNARVNLAIARALGGTAFFEDLKIWANQEIPLTIGFNKGPLTRDLEQLMQDSEATTQLAGKGLLQVIYSSGHDSLRDSHAFGENPIWYADIATRSLLFIKEQRAKLATSG